MGFLVAKHVFLTPWDEGCDSFDSMWALDSIAKRKRMAQVPRSSTELRSQTITSFEKIYRIVSVTAVLTGTSTIWKLGRWISRLCKFLFLSASDFSFQLYRHLLYLFVCCPTACLSPCFHPRSTCYLVSSRKLSFSGYPQRRVYPHSYPQVTSAILCTATPSLSLSLRFSFYFYLCGSISSLVFHRSISSRSCTQRLL